MCRPTMGDYSAGCWRTRNRWVRQSRRLCCAISEPRSARAMQRPVTRCWQRRLSADAPERQVSGQARGIVGGVRELLAVDLMPNYARYVPRLFAARAAVLGWTAKPGDDEETQLLRTAPVPFCGTQW